MNTTVNTSLKILVVDDHSLVRKAIIRVFKDKEGIIFLESSSLEDARAHLKENSLDLLILDLSLKGEYGGELITDLRSDPLHSDTPILIVTGEGTKDDLVKSVALGASDFLLKPFLEEDLAKKVLGLLKRSILPDSFEHAKRELQKAVIASEFEKAEVYLNKCRELRPDAISNNYFLGVISEKKGDFENAIAAFESCLRTEPNYYFARSAIARIFYLQKDYENAIKHLEMELAQNPKQPDKQVMLGKLLLRFSRHEEAAEKFRDALKFDSRFMSALFGMAKAYSQMQDVDRSLHYYKRIRRSFPDNTEALVRLVSMCHEAGQPKKAEIVLRDEIVSRKNSLDSYVLLAKLYAKDKKTNESLEVIQKGLAVEPYHYELLKLYFRVLGATGREADILGYFQREPVRFDETVSSCLIRILIELERKPLLETFLNRYASKWKDDVGVGKFLGKMMIENHEQAKAVFFALTQRMKAHSSEIEGLSKALGGMRERRKALGKLKAAS